MQRAKARECVWYREKFVGDHKACVGAVKNDAGRELVVTILGNDTKEVWKYPANFWAQVQSDEDIADTLVIAFIDDLLRRFRKILDNHIEV